MEEFIDRRSDTVTTPTPAMRQAGILAAAGIQALAHRRERLAEDHGNARRLAQGLAELPGVSVNPDDVETNIVIFDVAPGEMTAPQVARRMNDQGLLIHAFGKTQIRLVTHLGVSAEDIEQARRSSGRFFVNPILLGKTISR
jgi:threonine aldolase